MGEPEFGRSKTKISVDLDRETHHIIEDFKKKIGITRSSLVRLILKNFSRNPYEIYKELLDKEWKGQNK